MSKSLKADVIIIGAGIIGASCAFRLSDRGLRVVILEAQSAPAMGSTGRSAAGVRVQFTEEVNIHLFKPKKKRLWNSTFLPNTHTLSNL